MWVLVSQGRFLAAAVRHTTVVSGIGIGNVLVASKRVNAVVTQTSYNYQVRYEDTLTGASEPITATADDETSGWMYS